MSTVLEPRTYLPSGRLDEVSALLESSTRPEIALIDDGRAVPLPEEINEILAQVIAAMREGKAITVTPRSQRLTTQQTADLLGISSPTVVKLIDSGELPCTRTSSRRTVLLDDVLAYRRRRQDEQLAAIAATQAELDDDLDASTVVELLAEARRARGSRRREA